MPGKPVLDSPEREKIFRRDRFTCQFCGRSFPDVLLDVDVSPLFRKKEGDMVTSCYECTRRNWLNRGSTSRPEGTGADDAVVLEWKRQKDWYSRWLNEQNMPGLKVGQEADQDRDPEQEAVVDNITRTDENLKQVFAPEANLDDEIFEIEQKQEPEQEPESEPAPEPEPEPEPWFQIETDAGPGLPPGESPPGVTHREITSGSGKIPPDLSPFWFRSWLLYILMKVSGLDPMEAEEAFIMTVTGMENAGTLPEGEGLLFIDSLRDAAQVLAGQGYLVADGTRGTIRLTETGITVSRMIVPPGLLSKDGE
jgi:hypothetical protein